MEFVSTHKWKIIAVGAVLCALAFYLDRAEAAETYCEVSLWQGDGFNGPSAKCPGGIKGDKGETGAAGAKGVAGNDGNDGADGANGDKGDKGDKGDTGAKGLDGKDFDMDESLALNAALSLPVWLGDEEKVRISGGLGFSGGGETAIGATGVARLDKNWAGFVGGAVSTDGGNWAGKAGFSVGW